MENKLPKYVKLGSVALCLKTYYNDVYYRDAGAWWVEYKLIDDKLYSVSDMEWLNNVELIEITEEEWRKNNGMYA